MWYLKSHLSYFQISTGMWNLNLNSEIWRDFSLCSYSSDGKWNLNSEISHFWFLSRSSDESWNLKSEGWLFWFLSRSSDETWNLGWASEIWPNFTFDLNGRPEFWILNSENWAVLHSRLINFVKYEGSARFSIKYRTYIWQQVRAHWSVISEMWNLVRAGHEKRSGTRKIQSGLDAYMAAMGGSVRLRRARRFFAPLLLDMADNLRCARLSSSFTIQIQFSEIRSEGEGSLHSS